MTDVYIHTARKSVLYIRTIIADTAVLVRSYFTCCGSVGFVVPACYFRSAESLCSKQLYRPVLEANTTAASTRKHKRWTIVQRQQLKRHHRINLLHTIVAKIHSIAWSCKGGKTPDPEEEKKDYECCYSATINKINSKNGGRC